MALLLNGEIMRFEFLIVTLFCCIVLMLSCSDLDLDQKTNNDLTSLDSAISKYENYLYKDGVPGGSIKLPHYVEFKSFNPFVEPQAVPFMYDGLVRLSGDKMTNSLAGKLEVSSDSLSWRFKLREGLLWSDSSALTTDDVIFTYNKALENCDESNIYYSLVSEDSPLRPYTITLDPNNGIVFKFETYSENVRELFTLPILPKHKYENMVDGSFCDSLSVNTPIDCMAGSGPFILASYAPFGRVVFVKNKYYYRKDYSGQSLPYLDTLEFVMLSDIEEALAEFKNNELDFLAADGVDLKELKKDNNFYRFKQSVSHNGNMLLFNKDEDFISSLGTKGIDILSQLIPRSLILDSLLNKDGQEDAPLLFWFNKMKKTKVLSSEKISKILKDEGFKNDAEGNLISVEGKKVKCLLLVSSANGFRSQMADIIADKFKSIGITVEVDKVGPEEFITKIGNAGWSIALTSYDEGNSTRSALTFWSELTTDSVGKNELINFSKKSFNIKNVDTLLWEDMLASIEKNIPAIFLVRSNRNILVSKRIRNVNPSPLGGFTGDISRLYIASKGKSDGKQ